MVAAVGCSATVQRRRRAATRAHLPRDLMKEAAPVAAVSNEVAAVALVISALALGAQSPALG